MGWGGKTGMSDKEPLLDVAQEAPWHFAVKIPQILYKPMEDTGPCQDRPYWDIFLCSDLWGHSEVGREVMVWTGGVIPERSYDGFTCIWWGLVTRYHFLYCTVQKRRSFTWQRHNIQTKARCSQLLTVSYADRKHSDRKHQIWLRLSSFTITIFCVLQILIPHPSSLCPRVSKSLFPNALLKPLCPSVPLASLSKQYKPNFTMKTLSPPTLPTLESSFVTVGLSPSLRACFFN